MDLWFGVGVGGGWGWGGLAWFLVVVVVEDFGNLGLLGLLGAGGVGDQHATRLEHGGDVERGVDGGEHPAV